jgi:hypothetical protein
VDEENVQTIKNDNSKSISIIEVIRRHLLLDWGELDFIESILKGQSRDR